MTFNPALPKWPAMRVVGQPITADQAGEILIRTAHWPPFTNDKGWLREIHDICGLQYSEYNGYIVEDWESVDAFRKQCKVLDLEYLVNAQIASSYIGGPVGWCDWTGCIGCNSFNIGKWPSVETVHKEWTSIAEAWPFLDLKCRLYDREQNEAGGVPVVDYIVQTGKCTMQEPESDLAPVPAKGLSLFNFDLFRPGREQGCSPVQLRNAVRLLKESVGSPTLWEKVLEED